MTELLAGAKAIRAAPAADHSEGMSYLESLPRRLVTLYLPLSLIVIILLFPFYWMALTAIKPDEQLLNLDKFNPFWTWKSGASSQPFATKPFHPSNFHGTFATALKTRSAPSSSSS